MIQSAVLEVAIGVVLLIAGYYLGLFQEARKRRKYRREAVSSILVELDPPITEMVRHIHGFRRACEDELGGEYCHLTPIFDTEIIEKQIKDVEYFSLLPGKCRKDLLHGAKNMDICFAHFNALKASQRFDPITINNRLNPHRSVLNTARSSMLAGLRNIEDHHTADADRPSLIKLIEVVERANI